MSDHTMWDSFATYFVQPSQRSNDSNSGSRAPTEASPPRGGSLISFSHALKTHAIRLDEKKASTRAGFLRTLAELIGPRPANDADGRLPWREEYEALSIVCLDNDREQQGEPRHFEGTHTELRSFLQTSEGADYCLNNEIDLPHEMKIQQANIERLVARGWHREHAESYTLLFPLRSGLSADLDRSTTEVRFPGCNYAMAEALFQTALNQQAQRLDDAAKLKGKAAAVAGAPRRLYKHLTGPNSLTEADGAWAGLNVPDRTGFRGLTSTALCIATDEPRAFTTLGFRNATSVDGEGIYQLNEGGDIVCFEGAENEEELMHQCVMIDEHNGALPANTLFRLKRVEEPGTWEVEGMSMPISPTSPVVSAAKTDRKAKPKAGAQAKTSADCRRDSAEAERALVLGLVKPNCRLFVVSCTFKRPTEVGDGGRTFLTGKMSGAVNTLVYGSRETYINGLDDSARTAARTPSRVPRSPTPTIPSTRCSLLRLWGA
ncbi:hypothetical protein Ctob_000378 [Chrysochromulina tobinii]|uniref:Uncharacterized protein n=1 Tax=Chrysochromulina tobinii TaxID=1460289 RepID=A0A0M0J4A1_9EUKA|nr:hypothetical protein Ctob_000378 [Chrysochromulina tobinii]|eukprot:KOO21414.1 hypothetical protein Ctob_000378 [Chrysochromulina sp. CCMP291]